MKPTQSKKLAAWAVVLVAVSLALVGCRPTEPTPPAEPDVVPSSPEPSIETQPPAAENATPVDDSDEPQEPDEEDVAELLDVAPRDLGQPLVDEPSSLVQLEPGSPAWIDVAGRRVIMVGEVCGRTVPLEMFACLRNTKEHESVVCVATRAMNIHAALLRVGAEPGHPVVFQPSYAPATGCEIDVTVRWKDAQGDVQTARAQDWVRNYDTKKPLEHPWVFGGSGFWTDEQTGTRHYQAEGGDFICVANFPSAMLDLPIESSDKDGSLLFEAFTERIPPLGTPVTVILTPNLAENERK